MSMKANEVQVGGSHYLYPLQPFKFGLHNPCITGVEFSVIRYLMRCHKKNGLQDLEKAKHCVQWIGTEIDNHPDVFRPRNLEKVYEFTDQFDDLPPFAHASLVEFLLMIEDGVNAERLNYVVGLIDMAIIEHMETHKEN